MNYQWKNGYPGKVDPNIAGKELNRIRRKNHGISADMVLEEARPKDSLLHPQVFDMSRNKAAESYYRANARKLITSIVVVTDDEGVDEPATVPVFAPREIVSLSDEPRNVRIYDTIDQVVNTPEYYEFYLGAARSEMSSFCAKYKRIVGLKKLVEIVTEEIDKAREKDAAG